MDNPQEQQRIALITGANKGIGLETARQLARDHGFTVLIGARDEKRGAEAASQLQSEGLDAQLLLLDPTDPTSVERARSEVETKFGHLDVLVNNAGTSLPEDLAAPSTVATSVLRDIYDLNVFAVHEVTRAFWPLLERSRGARLVNVSSLAGSLAAQADFAGPMKEFNSIGYMSSKAAVNMMTVSFAKQWDSTPHRANAIHPGSVATDLNPGGELTLEEGAKSSVDLATIPNEGPNGTFWHLGEAMPW